MKLSTIRDRVAVDAIKWAPKSMFSGLVGWGAKRTLPRVLRAPIYNAFASVVGAELSEVEHPLEEYRSFGSFFVRGLKNDARPLPQDPRAWVSPCDSQVAEAGSLSNQAVSAKGRSFSLEALLASTRLALDLEDGDFATLYLSPRDYHRVHIPADCQLIGYQHIPGSLYPVSPFYLQNIDNLFAMNERLVMEFTTVDGHVFAMVMVAAAGVGNLCLTHPALRTHSASNTTTVERVQLVEPLPLARGEEIGAFALGSTVILCTAAGLLEYSLCLGESLHFGDTIGSRTLGENE